MREKQDRKDENISPRTKEKSKCFLIFYFIFISMGTADEKCCLYFHDLQSRDIPKASFPNGYTLLTWQEGAEKIWLDIVTKAFEPGFLTDWTCETFIQRYFNKPQFHKDGFFLVKYGSNFIATAFAWQEQEVSSQGILHWLAVLPEHRRKDIAKALCYHVLQYHKDNGKNMVLLKTEVYRDKAIQLYEKIGFTSQNNLRNRMNVGQDKWLYYLRELQSKRIAEPDLPQGYSLHTWHDGAEDVWMKLVQEAFGHKYVLRSIPLETESFMERYYRKPRFNKDGFFLVKNGAEYVATAFAWEDGMSSCCGRLLWLAVSPKHRRKGIGKALCRSVLKYHKSSGKRFVWLRIGPTKTREAAAKLYENVGFIRE